MWKSSTKHDLSIITPPSVFLPQSGPTIFLAGSMNQDVENHWRKTAIDYIRYRWFSEADYNITIFNPRRENWIDTMEQEQTAWNIFNLESAKYIILHLCKNSGVSPESLLEIGMYMNNPKMFISIEDGHPKRLPLEIHIAKYGHNNLFYTFIDSIDAIKTKWEKLYE